MSRKATIVSLFPETIIEEKPGLYPGRFTILKAPKEGDFSVTHIDESMFFVRSMNETTIHVKNPAYENARSVVDDFVIAQIGLDPEDASVRPGLFWLDGEYSKKEVEEKFSKELLAAKLGQRKWYQNLCKIADDDWKKTGLHRSITEMQRHAGRVLGLTRDWLFEIPAEGTTCPACTMRVPAGAVVCPQCKCVVDKKRFEALEFAGVK